MSVALNPELISMSITTSPVRQPDWRLTPAFSCGARSAFKLEGKGYLRNMLPRRQLQGFVGLRCTGNLAPRNAHTRQEGLRITEISLLSMRGGFNILAGAIGKRGYDTTITAFTGIGG